MKRMFLLRRLHLFLKGSRRLAGIRSVLSHARKIMANAEEKRANTGPKGVSQPRIMRVREIKIGRIARGISWRIR